MKNNNAKKPTKKQCIFLNTYGIDYKDWLIASDNKEEMCIIHRHTGTRRKIRKEEF